MRRPKKRFGPTTSIRKDNRTGKYFVWLYFRPDKKGPAIRKAYLGGDRYEDAHALVPQIQQQFVESLQKPVVSAMPITIATVETASTFQPVTGSAKMPATPATTLKNYFEKYFLPEQQKIVSASTLSIYKNNFRHIESDLGRAPLSTVTRTDVKSWIGSLTEKTYERSGQRHPFSKDQVRLTVNLLRKIFYVAMDEGLVQSNPASRMGKSYKQLRTVYDPRTFQPLDRSEFEAIYAAVIKVAPWYEALIYALLNTGCRIGELAALRWRSCILDVPQPFLIIDASLSRNRKLGPTKTQRSRNVIIGRNLLVPLLKKHRANMGKKFKTLPDFVFCNKKGDPLDVCNFRNRYFKKILTEADIKRRFRIHDCRHSYAALILSSGKPIEWLQKQLGHSSISLTVDLYGHFRPENNSDPLSCLPGESPESNNMLQKEEGVA